MMMRVIMKMVMIMKMKMKPMGTQMRMMIMKRNKNRRILGIYCRLMNTMTKTGLMTRMKVYMTIIVRNKMTMKKRTQVVQMGVNYWVRKRGQVQSLHQVQSLRQRLHQSLRQRLHQTL